MSTIRLHRGSHGAALAARAMHQAVSAAALVLGLLLVWYRRHQQRHDLALLDARALADVGLSRADVEREIDKPFWR